MSNEELGYIPYDDQKAYEDSTAAMSDIHEMEETLENIQNELAEAECYATPDDETQVTIRAALKACELAVAAIQGLDSAICSIAAPEEKDSP